MKKLDAIQVLRGVAALIVVTCHASDMVQGAAHETHLSRYTSNHLGGSGVDLFFCISGFILASIALRLRPSPTSPLVAAADFLSRRFLRILPIYWLTSLFVVILEVKHHNMTLAWFVDSMLLLPSLHFPLQGPIMFIGWTLIFEMFFYYMMTLNLLFGTRHIVERTVLTIVTLIAIGLLIGFQRPVLILMANPLNLEFVFGCVLALLFNHFGTRPRIATTLWVSGCVLLGSTYFFSNFNTGIASFTLNGQLSWYRVMVWGIPAAMITGGLAFRQPGISSRPGRIAVYLGNASYSIYLVSVMVLYFYERIYFVFARLSPDLNVLLAVAVVAVVGVLCHRFVETPINRYLASRYTRIAIPRAEPIPLQMVAE